MSRRRRPTWLLLLTGVLVTVVPLPALAQRVQSNVVLVRSDDVITEDLYAAGNTIVVSGVIQGDLVAIAFDSIRIDGVVEGDVVALSSRVEISGRVGGAVRVGAWTVVVEGDVSDDLVVGASSVSTGSTSTVGRDILGWGRTVELLGNVGRNIEGTQSVARVAGTVAGDIDVTVSELTLLPGLVVVGDVRYVADDEATVAQTVTIDGTFIRAEALPPNLRVRGVRLLVQILGVLSALGLGIGILWAIPARALAAANAVERRSLSALAWGVGVASVPVALSIVIVGIVSVTSLSSSGPLVLVMVPVVVAVASVILLGMLAAPVPVSIAIGRRIRGEWSSYAQFVVGFPVLALVFLLPWVGAFLAFGAALLGLGSWLVAADQD